MAGEIQVSDDAAREAAGRLAMSGLADQMPTEIVGPVVDLVLAAALPLLRQQWESDALREAAEAYATQWRSAARLGRAVDLPRAEAGFVAWLNEQATAPETVGALPVVAGSEAEASCQVNVWGGPYRACGRTLVNGKCGHHG